MRDLTRTGRAINSKIGKAIGEYDLIQDGDKILVAVSGGKDSLTLLTLLKAIQSWAPVKFELTAAHVKSDLHCGSSLQDKALIKIFEELGVKYKFLEIEVLDSEEKTTCFWCSWNRRKSLFEYADEARCNKVALGHHKDDIVETMLMNLLYNGEISAINPNQEMFGGKLHIIRPLCYVEENTIKKFAKERGFPDELSQCPFGRDSRRKYVKDLIKDAEQKTKANIKTNIFNSLSRIREEYIDLKPSKD